MTALPGPIALGARRGTLEAGGFIVTATSHAPRAGLLRHYHGRANVMFVIRGSLSERCGKRTIECGPRSLLVEPAGEPHPDDHGPRGMRSLLIEVPTSRLEALGPVSSAFERVHHLSGGPATRLAGRLYREFVAPDAASPLAIEAIILELLVDVARQGTAGARRPPAWMARVLDALRAKFREPLDLATLAGIAGVHPVHLAREFRRHRGCTPGEYQRSLRVSAAARALSETRAPLVEIALAAGFSHQSHFCRVFKRHMGMTPSEFRRAHRPR